MIRRSGIKCCLSKLRHRIKRQSYTTIILLANNIVAIIQLFEHNKYQIPTFLLEPLAKKICSVSFVSQYSLLTQRILLPVNKTTLVNLAGVTKCGDNVDQNTTSTAFVILLADYSSTTLPVLYSRQLFIIWTPF